MFSDVLFVKLYFNQTGNIVGGASATTNKVFRGNSVYDPDYTGAGTQPMGYDQWSAFYNKVHVLGSKVICKVLPGSDYAQQISIYPTTDVAGSPATDLREIPYSKTFSGGPYTGQANRWGTLVKYMSTAKIWGVSKAEVKDADIYGHSTATNPTNVWFWYLQADTFGNGVPVANSITYDIKIVYYCMFKERVNLNES